MITKANKILFLSLIVHISYFGIGQSDSGTLLEKEISKIIEYDTQINYDKTPGFVISVTDGDTSYFLTFGKSIDSNTTLNRHSQFEIGGSSKIFSSTFFYDWISESDSVSLDTRISTLNLNINNPYIDSLSLKHLIFNRTSFPKRPLTEFNLSRTNNPYQGYSWQDLIAFLSDTGSSVISEETAYSHINNALLQYIYEQLTKRSFIQSLETYLKADGINHTNFIIDSTFNWGQDILGNIAKPWYLQSFHASEGVLSNTTDICQYVRILMNNNTLIARLKSEARESIYRPSFYLSSGWSIIKGVGKFDIFAITGKTSGHSSFVAFIPETKTAVSILCNSATSTDDLGMLILRMINNNFKRDNE